MSARFVLFLAILVGCGSSDKEAAPRPAIITPEMAETFELYVAAFEKIANDVGAPGMDCHKAVGIVKRDGEAVAALAGRGDALRAAMKGAKDPAARDWFAATFAARFKTATLKMGTLVTLCKDDPLLKLAMNEVMSQFPMMKKKAQP